MTPEGDTGPVNEKQRWTEQHVEWSRQAWRNIPRWRVIDRWLAWRNYRHSRELADSVAWRRDIATMLNPPHGG